MAYLLSPAGVSTRQLVGVDVTADNDLELPRRKHWVVVIVTAIVSARKFYVQLPLGLTSPLSVARGALPTQGIDYYP